MHRAAALHKIHRRHGLFSSGSTVVEFGCLPGVLADYISRAISSPQRQPQPNAPVGTHRRMAVDPQIEQRLLAIDKTSGVEEDEKDCHQHRGLLVGVDRRPAPSTFPGVFVMSDVVSMYEAQRQPLAAAAQPSQQLLLPRGPAAQVTLTSVLIGSRHATPGKCVDAAVIDLFDDERSGDATAVENGMRASVAAVNVIRPFLRPSGKILLRLALPAGGMSLRSSADAGRHPTVRPLLRDLRARFATAECVMLEGARDSPIAVVHLLAGGTPVDAPFARGKLHSPALLRNGPRPKAWSRLAGTSQPKRFFVAARPAFTTAPSGLGHKLVDRQKRTTESVEAATERDETLKDFSFRMFESDDISRPRQD